MKFTWIVKAVYTISLATAFEIAGVKVAMRTGTRIPALTLLEITGTEDGTLHNPQGNKGRAVRHTFPTPPSPNTTSLYIVIFPAMIICFLIFANPDQFFTQIKNNMCLFRGGISRISDVAPVPPCDVSKFSLSWPSRCCPFLGVGCGMARGAYS